MRGLSGRATSSLVATCLLFALSVLLVGIVGLGGIMTARSTDSGLVRDQLATSQATDAVGETTDEVYAQAQLLLLDAAPSDRAGLVAQLFETTVPAADAAVAALIRLHATDPVAQRARVATIPGQWAAVRNLLNPATLPAVGHGAPRLAALDTAFGVLSTHIATLVTDQNDMVTRSESHAAAVAARATWFVVLGVLLSLVLAGICLRVGGRRIRRAFEPARDQVEFADALQLTGAEEDAQQLLQRHLERAVAGSAVTVLNRNNSADRLEAKTALPEGSPLIETLRHAEPRSCLAVRSGQIHSEDDRHPPLLGCPVCSGCPGSSSCTPLTVGGEVIGAVLVQRAAEPGLDEQRRIRDSVGQAAPVLANLRNLAIAELRAATDGLTGLPNKRAVGDGLKRMLAQASRTLTPMALLMLDLDHFKNLNDTFGHPVGDQALSGVGAALKSVLRDSDFAGRNGGEEFVVVLPDTDTAGALVAAERIRAAIADISLPGVGASVTASVGVAVYPEHATSADQLERLADSALYVAKRSGRNRVLVTDHADAAAALAAAPATEPDAFSPGANVFVADDDEAAALIR
jgi:diguanylate cyclase (GGDEF)-like protein